ncbi:Starch-binding associating with outer membrane [Flavobacterium glycines]|uniref:Carbohydrate-binding protein SusD n=1 Tax=Flavobacterium glycines TaxID=551990 RepID=A0A1B9DR87_9FLAO|nr:RagB/SusD family nutrient uptake outer membrane protein [Flavobacterium glycines]OCB72216.1 carbohydrate-binding protein SusD [Flavobacterium glycines]GEL09672.1 starch-binding protein [Flavobacterium glycines]SDI97982.1 Starch-binding associating with outer membrane [Flavobacterium glycines]
MKKILLYISIVTLGVFTSCNSDDFLDAPAKSSLDESIIFSNAGLAKGAVDGIKVPFGETNSYRGRFLPWYGLNTDVEWYNTSQTASANTELCNYNTPATNTNMNTTNNAWAMMYSGIERANICIRGLRNYGNPQPGTELGYLLGESLTLRAVYYADLLKAWGDIPARFEPISSETLYLPRSSRDVIYKQIIADLGEAEDLVPWPNATTATSNVERVNKAFVKALRARLAMAASGFQQYSDGIRRSNDADLSVAKMYQLALDECKDIINSGTAHLESSFETLWKKYNQEDLTAGGESLWQIPFADGRGRMLFTFAVRHNSVDQFQANGTNKGGVCGPLPFVFYDYNKNDTRRNVSCVPYKYGTAVSGVAKQELNDLDTWYFGKYRYEWMSRYVTSTNDDGVDKLYMRYAEVLLIAAEAANELEGPTAAAAYLKEIRKRAFPTAYQATMVESYVNALTTKEAMFNAIVDEHKFEFTGEMERKQALIRWNLLKTKLDEAKVKMTNLQARTGEYADVPSTLYFKTSSDNVSLDIYGLNRGETTNPGVEYTAKTWVKLDAVKISSLYDATINPDAHQFWPIWQVFIDGSNQQLTNN